MRIIRLLIAAVVGLFALIAAGFVAVLVLVGGAIGLLLSRLGLARGNIKVNLQRGPTAATRAAFRNGARVHAPDAIDVEATTVANEAATTGEPRGLPGDRS